MANELNGLAAWLYEMMAAEEVITDIVGRHPSEDVWQIYEVAAPQGARLPYIIFWPISAPPRNGAGGRKVMVRTKWGIKPVGGGNTFAGDLTTLSDKIDSMFQIAQDLERPLVIGASIVNMIPQYVEFDKGVRYNHGPGSEVQIFAYTQGD